jgi:probable phosphoglycerate mutase
MVKTVYLARHGETDWNRVGRWQGATDIPLNDLGRAQARALAERLRTHGVTRVHASDLSRAHETATIVAAELGIAFGETSARFRERSFGVFEGLTRVECETRWPEAWQAYVDDFHNAPPDAEPAARVIERMRAGVAHVVRASPPARGGAADGAGATLIVSHGACIRMLVSSLSPPGAPQRGPIHNAAIFRAQVREAEIVEITEL